MSIGSLVFDGDDPGGLIALRRELHQAPEISGEERQTAARIAGLVESLRPDAMLAGLGGTGVAAVFDSGRPGPAVLFRAELDGLPIHETGDRAWRSRIEGRGHLCGHDGHMAILAGLASVVAARRPGTGRVIVLFQPAEETGAGASAVIADPRFATLSPDYAFALHNLPGLPLGSGAVRTGASNFASEGLSIRLEGRTAHASQPEAGLSPATAVCELIAALPDLPSKLGFDPGTALSTLVHARLGEAAFGIAPGEADVWATLRSVDDRRQQQLMRAARELVLKSAERHGLTVALKGHDRFAACRNHPDAEALVRTAFALHDVAITEIAEPFRWSEDFGLFGSVAKSALFVLGAGVDHPRLHNPDYDFPDELIPLGVRLFAQIARSLCD